MCYYIHVVLCSLNVHVVCVTEEKCTEVVQLVTAIHVLIPQWNESTWVHSEKGMYHLIIYIRVNMLSS